MMYAASYSRVPYLPRQVMPASSQAEAHFLAGVGASFILTLPLACYIHENFHFDFPTYFSHGHRPARDILPGGRAQLLLLVKYYRRRLSAVMRPLTRFSYFHRPTPSTAA